MSFAIHFFNPNLEEEKDAPAKEDAPANEEKKVVAQQPVTTKGLIIHKINDAHENFL